MFAAYALVLLFASSVPLQSHPCDLVPPTQLVAAQVGVGFCHNNLDSNGSSVTITSFRVTMDGATVFTGLLNPIGPPNAQGLFYYETPKTIPVTKGNRAFQQFASSVDGESAGSDIVVVQIKGVPPGKGKISTVIKGQ